MDHEALHHYLTYMTVPGPWSIYEGIKKLPPGHYLHVKDGQTSLVPYWAVPTEQDGSMQEGEMIRMLGEHLERSVSSQLISDVPLGAFLSGGVDSSAVVGMMRRDPARDIRTFSISFPGLGEHDESAYAKTVADHFHTTHRDFAVSPNLIDVLPRIAWHCDEPFAVSSAFALYFLARMARQHVTVALTGDGGDEVFAGYPFRYSMDERFDRWAWMPQTLRGLGADVLEKTPAVGNAAMRDLLVKLRTYAAFFRTDADEAFFRTFTFFDERAKSSLYADGFNPSPMPPTLGLLRSRYAKAKNADRVNRRLCADIGTTLVDEMLTKVDRMTMASSLEARVPLLDHRLVEFAARIPGHMKIRGSNGKIPLKRVLQGLVPDHILARRKHGFNVPMAHWLRNELSEMMHDLLSEETVRRRGFFRPEAVLRLMDDHQHRRANNEGQLYILMNLELWHRLFIERSISPPGSGPA
jgi:asparagine synthase (glutamine-hydrolysing)